jgi:CubicO group peptidase (beta-lactamase class C family)
VAVSSQSTSEEASSFAPVRAFITKELHQQSVPSVAVAVAHHGRIVWEEAFGWADREQPVPATTQTIYRVASVTKAIVGMSLLILSREGRLDLDRPVNDYLGPSPLTVHIGDPAAATVRRLANHTAGLTTHYQSFPDGPASRPGMEETIRRYGHVFNPPGERFDYSNLGYGILGHVITRVSGRPLADFLVDEIFAPLGMTSSVLADGDDMPEPLAARRAAQYGSDGRREVECPCDHVGASSVAASIHDLARLGVFLVGTPLEDQRGILSASERGELFRPTTVAWGDDGYGLGWRSTDRPPGYTKLSAQGGTDSATAILELMPQERLAVAVLVNTGSLLAGEVVERVYATLLPGYPSPGNPDGSVARAAPPEPALVPSVLVGRFAGLIHTYEGERPSRSRCVQMAR